MKRLIFLLAIFFSINPVYGFWWKSTNNEKNICLQRISKITNEFSAKILYKKCLKELKRTRKERKKAYEKLQMEQKTCKQNKEFQISRFERVYKGKNKKNSSVPQITDEARLEMIEREYDSCIRLSVFNNLQ